MYFREEKRIWQKGYKFVAGLDEAGRGPLAGPVTACVVLVRPPAKEFRLPKELRGVNDSKKLTVKKREEFYEVLKNHPFIEWGTGMVGPKVIDRINILEATKLAMGRAVKNLERKCRARIEFLILDGNFTIKLKIPQTPIIRADQKIFSCQAASIISKVTRDRMMRRYHRLYPQYGFDKHNGYPTRLHRQNLLRYGPCEIHRKSFWPVRAFLA